MTSTNPTPDPHEALNRAHRRRHRRVVWMWTIAVAVAVAAFSLGYDGFETLWARACTASCSEALPAAQEACRSDVAARCARVSGLRQPEDFAYYSLQLFTLESNVGADTEIPLTLKAARLLAALFTGFAVLQAAYLLFRRQFLLVRMRLSRRHVIVCGLGEKGYFLVRDLLARRERVVLIEKDADNDAVATCRELGALVLVGDARDRENLRLAGLKRARHLVAVCDDGTNVEIAIRARDLLAEKIRWYSARQRVQGHIHLIDLTLCDFFKEHELFTDRSDRFDVVVFNVFENAARLLFQEHAVEADIVRQDDPRRVHLVVFGATPIAEGVLVQAARTAHFANGPRWWVREVRATLIDPEATRAVAGMVGRHRALLEVLELEPVDREPMHADVLASLRAWAADDAQVVTAIVATRDEAANVSQALNLLEHVGEHRLAVLVWMGHETGIATLLSNDQACPDLRGSVRPFGQYSRTCSADAVLEETLDGQAQAAHKAYVTKQVAEREEKARREGKVFDPSTDPSLRDWKVLSESLRESNRQQADHIAVKLRAVGYEAVPPAANETAPCPFTDGQIEMLARMEHARWCADRWMDGWRLGPAKNPALRIHTDLVPWESLSDGTRAWDINAVGAIPTLLALADRRLQQKPTKG